MTITQETVKNYRRYINRCASTSINPVFYKNELDELRKVLDLAERQLSTEQEKVTTPQAEPELMSLEEIEALEGKIAWQVSNDVEIKRDLERLRKTAHSLATPPRTTTGIDR